MQVCAVAITVLFTISPNLLSKQTFDKYCKIVSIFLEAIIEKKIYHYNNYIDCLNFGLILSSKIKAKFPLVL